ncbi:zinc finger CCCH domain-containing protein 39-like [Aristolochia californica]|uniref:zinc finger CCCH domain-containing protein 39-like n=1 Tax=Aristolochia californica TaxID=171875 RepID=UPI0035DD18ED
MDPNGPPHQSSFVNSPPQYLGYRDEFIPADLPGKPVSKRPRSIEVVQSNPSFSPNNAHRAPVPPQFLLVNKEKFFKTKLCTKFKLGICDFGSSCTFAHGQEELRPNWLDTEQQRVSRLKICRSFYNGEECPYGDRCTFLHEDPDRVRECSVINIATSTTAAGINRERSGDGNGLNQKPFFWKTRLCHKWELTGHCQYGEDCHYAHGQAELRHVESENDNGRMGPSKIFPHPYNDINDGPPTQGPMITSCKQEEPQVKRCILNWKGPNKISRIYGDWIEDLPPYKVES